ncbi:hypothetical protein ACQKKK_17315 [Peribacillus sp. NPDC006672]|uniref:hypothetical protein n=1 Tax=Peribacillus sp. NPDC006672 TaxID=3390606 RepID=UPI003D07C8C2
MSDSKEIAPSLYIRVDIPEKYIDEFKEICSEVVIEKNHRNSANLNRSQQWIYQSLISFIRWDSMIILAFLKKPQKLNGSIRTVREWRPC